MQLIVVFEENTRTGTFYIAGVADNPKGADKIAAISLSKGIHYRAYTDTYTFSGSLNRDCYVVYVNNTWLDNTVHEKDDDRILFRKMYFTGDKPSGADIKIYKSEDSALKKMDTIVEELVDPNYEHYDSCEPACVNIRINEAGI